MYMCITYEEILYFSGLLTHVSITENPISVYTKCTCTDHNSLPYHLPTCVVLNL